jgi:DNA-binding MarR family transcriptional regulator
MDYYKADTYRAQDSIGYLMWQTTIKVRAKMELQLAPFGLTFSQWLTLLWLRDGVANTAGEIAKQMNVDPGAMARSLDDLEKRDWITRTRSLQDRRVVALELTDGGRAELQLALPTILSELNQALGNFTRAEADQLTALLKKLLLQQGGNAAS